MATILFSRSSGEYYWNSSTSTAFNFIYGDYSTSLTATIPSDQQTNSVTLRFSNPDEKISTSSGLSKTIDCYFYFDGSYIGYKSITLSSISSSWTKGTIYPYSISLGGNYSNGTLKVELSSNYDYGDSDRLCVTTHSSSSTYGSYTTTSSAIPQTSTLTVYYNANGGTGAPSSHKITGTYDSSEGQYYYSGYLSSTEPTKTGYTFSHWSATGLTENYGPGAILQGWGPANDSVTFVANWTANKYTISYNANGGDDKTVPASQTKTHGVDLTLSSTEPTRTGYTFSGWGTSSTTTTVSYEAGDPYSDNANATLYAIWKANTYSIKYNANGGSGTMSNSSHTYDKAKALTANAFKRPGYEFLGWATSATATTIKYTDKQSVKNLTSKNGATFNLYAIWELMSNVRIYDGSAWKLAIPYVYEGGKWVLAVSKIYDGSWRQ